MECRGWHGLGLTFVFFFFFKDDTNPFEFWALFCAVLSKTLFARLSAWAAAEDVCKVEVVCHANTLVEVILLGRWYVPEGLQ